MNERAELPYLHVSVRISASLYQSLHDVQVTVLARDEERCAAVLKPIALHETTVPVTG